MNTLSHFTGDLTGEAGVKKNFLKDFPHPTSFEQLGLLAKGT